MKTLEARLLALETHESDHVKPLPDVVADDVPADELKRLRRGGREVYRMAEFVELCL